MRFRRPVLALAVLLLIESVNACSTTPPAPTVLPGPLQTTATLTPVITLTFRPTEVLATPKMLDRDLEDSGTMRERRNQLVDQYIVPVVANTRVVAAMRAVPRHCFVPTDSLESAYGDYPLPIGYGQTISQPSLVAQMTELLHIEKGQRVLEIGTGSGYQAAILRQLTDKVYTVEIIPELAGTARAVLDALGYGDIHVDRRDGYYGWNEFAPYDAIIVTAAPDHLPNYLVQQLRPDGGRLVIPIGPVGDVQTLWLVIRRGAEIEMNRVMDVRFVPFTR
jgi:protein-L-isoaspartate(D-aspartate) O-methyltransferase